MLLYLCKTDAISNNSSSKLIIGETSLFIVKHRGTYHGFVNSCPHMQIPLDWDNNQFFDCENELIQCSTHGALFLITTGECIQGPCVGQGLTKITLEIMHGDIYWAHDV